MRLNIYAEELTLDTALVTKDASTGRIYYGIRFYLKSPKALHHGENDDDRSAVTIWVPWTARRGHNPGLVQQLLTQLLGRVAGVQQGSDQVIEPDAPED